MNFTEAIAKLKTIEGTADAIKAIESDRNSLNGEAESWKSKASGFESRMKRYEELIGANGGDADKAIATLKEQLDTLTKEKTTLTEQVKEKDGKIATLQLSSQIRGLGVSAAFDKFIEGGLIPKDKVSVKDEGVFVGEQSLADYANAQGNWMYAALFTGASDTDKENVVNPDGQKGPKGGNQSKGSTPKENAGVYSVLNTYSFPK